MKLLIQHTPPSSRPDDITKFHPRRLCLLCLQGPLTASLEFDQVFGVCLQSVSRRGQCPQRLGALALGPGETQPRRAGHPG